MDTPESNERSDTKQRKRFWILVGTLNAMLIAIVVVLAITLPNSDDESEKNEQQMDMPMPPSPSPTAQQWPAWEDPPANDGPRVKPTTYEEYQSDLLAALRREDSYLASQTEDSAITQALQWMINEDHNFEVGRTQPDTLIERFILAVFYFATSGPTWEYEWEEGPNYLSSVFLSNTTVCDWRGIDGLDDQGVFCDADSRVVGLEVNHCMSNASIPTEVILLQKLETLNLGNNKLEGSIPTELGLATSLTSLLLYLNEFRGEIPTQIGEMSNLRGISFGGNHLSGPLPSEIGNLGQLAWLELYQNDFSGEIPTDIQNMKNLREIDLSDNQRLSGKIPSEIGLMTSLEEINFEECDLTGSIPTEVGFLGSLETLGLAKNDFTGPIPSELGSLKNLSRLYLGFNRIVGTVPAELGQLMNLAYVEIQDNSLTGSVPAAVCSLRGGALDRLIMDCSIGADSVTTGVECDEPQCCSECH